MITEDRVREIVREELSTSEQLAASAPPDLLEELRAKMRAAVQAHPELAELDNPADVDGLLRDAVGYFLSLFRKDAGRENLLMIRKSRRARDQRLAASTAAGMSSSGIGGLKGGGLICNARSLSTASTSSGSSLEGETQ
jgi:hypothetical protein